MSTRKEVLDSVRQRLAHCIADLIRIPNELGPNESDLSVAQDLVDAVRRLSPEEAASVQLRRADEALGWFGSGQGRIDTIERLRELEKE